MIHDIKKSKDYNPRYNIGDFCCLKQKSLQKTRHVHGEHENCERRNGVGGVGPVQVIKFLASKDKWRTTFQYLLGRAQRPHR